MVIADLSLVYRELGMALPSDTAPWTEAEFLLMLDRAQRCSTEISGPGKDILADVTGKSLKKNPCL